MTVVDINHDRISAWQSDVLPIYEPGLFEIVQAVRDGISNGEHHTTYDAYGRPTTIYPVRPKLFFSTDVDQAIANADLIFVCVNTPTKTHGIGQGSAADLDFVESATRTIARVATQDKIVVEKSTVPCRTAQSIREIVQPLCCYMPWLNVHVMLMLRAVGGQRSSRGPLRCAIQSRILGRRNGDSKSSPS